MQLDTSFLERCLAALTKAHELLHKTEPEKIEFDMYRSACIKEFEIILEQSGKLLKKCLKPYFHSSREADKLYFKDIFRHASKHGLISLEETERWLSYRDNRNLTAHDYGVGFAKATLVLLPQFIQDSGSLIETLKKHLKND